MSWVNFELIRTGENYTGLCFTNFWKEYGPLYNIIYIEPCTYSKYARWYYYSYDKSSSKIKHCIWAFLAIKLAISIVIHWVFLRVALLHMILHVISSSVFVFTMLAWKSHILKYGINFTHMVCMIWVNWFQRPQGDLRNSATEKTVTKPLKHNQSHENEEILAEVFRKRLIVKY